MIRNSFTEGKNPDSHQNAPSKEKNSKGPNNTPLDFEKLQKKYADQDKQKIDAMKQRLFQLVKKDEEKVLTKDKQEKAEKERAIAQEEMEKKRKEDERQRASQSSNAPAGKSGRGTALMGKKKRKPTEPQPAETKPGGGKQ